MQAGKLRHRVQICTRPVTESPYGQKESETLTVVKTVWAEVKTLSGRELMAARQIASEATHQITIRYLEGLTRKRYLRWIDPRTKAKHEFDINHIDDVDQRHIEMVVIAKEATA